MSRYLDMVDHPSHVKKLTMEQLQQLAAEIRHELITKLAKERRPPGAESRRGRIDHRAAPRLFDAARQVCLGRQPPKLRPQTADRAKEPFRYHPHDRRLERLFVAHGEPARLLRRGPRRHGAFGGAGNVRGARSTRVGRKRGLHFRRRGADQRHFVRGASTTSRTRPSISSAFSTTTSGASPRTSAPFPPISTSSSRNPRYNQLQKDVERLVKRMPKGDLAIKLGHKAEEALKGAFNEVALEQNPAQVGNRRTRRLRQQPDF